MRSLQLQVARLAVVPALFFALLGESAAANPCTHPYPCGDEWPAELVGATFRLEEILYVRWPSFDGVEIEGWIGLPDLPEGVRAPVVLHVSPYFSNCVLNPALGVPYCAGGPEDETFWTDPPGNGGIPPTYPDGIAPWAGILPAQIISRGYAAAFFSTRGTGRSGGCFGYMSEDEQRDLGMIVDRIAQEPWSSGRVAIGGFSYASGLALAAGSRAGESLKAILPGAVVSDVYTIAHTPQGATRTLVAGLTTYLEDQFMFPAIGSGPEYVARHPFVNADRLCPEAFELMNIEKTSYVTEDRGAHIWEPRRMIDDYGEITAAVLLTHGFQDPWRSTATQESAVWEALDGAPKRMIEGQWGHGAPVDSAYGWPMNSIPDAAHLNPAWANDTWEKLFYNWIDYWLKGIGIPERLGMVDYQTDTGLWREATAWPPAGRQEVLYLRDDALRTTPGPGTRTFQSAPNPLDSHHNSNFVGESTDEWTGGIRPAPWELLCPVGVSGPTGSRGLVYESAPTTEDVTIAGNPFAYLELEADQPGGIVTLHLLDLAPDFRCDETGTPHNFRELASGSADLRFHQGNYRAVAFPVGDPTHVRIELLDLAEVVEADHILALTVSYGDGAVGWSSARPHFPNLTIHADDDALASHIVVPTVQGTFGGGEASLTYPPRPFTPP